MDSAGFSGAALGHRPGMAYAKGKEVFPRQHSSTSLLQFQRVGRCSPWHSECPEGKAEWGQKLDESLEVKGWGWLEAAQGPGQGSPTATQMGSVESCLYVPAVS